MALAFIISTHTGKLAIEVPEKGEYKAVAEGNWINEQNVIEKTTRKNNKKTMK